MNKTGPVLLWMVLLSHGSPELKFLANTWSLTEGYDLGHGNYESSADGIGSDEPGHLD